MVLYFHTPDWRDRREEGGRERRKHTINVDLGGGGQHIYTYVQGEEDDLRSSLILAQKKEHTGVNKNE